MTGTAPNAGADGGGADRPAQAAVARAMRQAAWLLDTDARAPSGELAAMRMWAPAGWGDTLRRRASAVERCGTGRGFLLAFDGLPSMVGIDRCRDRLCPRCWALAASSREPEARAVVDAARGLGLDVHFVTLTVPTTPITSSDPAATVAATKSLWRTVRQRSRRDGGITGGYVRWEATWAGRGGLRTHCHAHVVVLGDGGAGARIVARWLAAASGDGRHARRVAQDIQAVGDDGAGVTRYVLKYLHKPEAAALAPLPLLAASVGWYNVRVVERFGAVHGASLRGAAPVPLAIAAGEVRAALAAERARYSLVRLGALVDRLGLVRLQAIADQVSADAPSWWAASQAQRALELARRDPRELRAARDAVRLLPLTIGAAELLEIDVGALTPAPAAALAAVEPAPDVDG